MRYRNRSPRFRRRTFNESRSRFGHRRRLFENWNKIRKEAEDVLHDFTLGHRLRDPNKLADALDMYEDYLSIFHDEYEAGYAGELDELWDDLLVKKWRFTRHTVGAVIGAIKKYR